MPVVRYFETVVDHPPIRPSAVHEFHDPFSIPGPGQLDIPDPHPVNEFFCSKPILLAFLLAIGLFPQGPPFLEPLEKDGAFVAGVRGRRRCHSLTEGT